MNPTAQDERRSVGTVEPGFEPIRDAFDALLLADAGYSAQIAAVWHGRTVADLAGGPGLGVDAITGVFSVSKGVAAIVIGLLLDRGALALDAPVASYWPEFAAAGKADITVRTVLSHRAGILGPPEGFTPDELADSSLAAARLAADPPLWNPGALHGYHALSIGIVMEELVRRVTGSTLQALYESEVRAPRGVDFHLGLPESEEHRFRAVVPMSPTPAQLTEMSMEPGRADSLQALAFNALESAFPPAGGAFGPNSREMRAAGWSTTDQLR
ncbi:MAG: serine hydrolase domain-containing protein [Microbacterium sp.]|uniref:serine hydrolase domain-containing protein n=1 Tax=Microbacterium sp. TaxID=51671 RepID=UPI003241D6A2